MSTFVLIDDTTRVLVERWDDPGSYPNALAHSPKASFNYIEGIEGELVYNLTPTGVRWYKECPEDFIHEELQPSLPDGVLSVEWGHRLEGRRLTLWSKEVEAYPSYTGPEPDWDLIAKERHYGD